MDILTSELFQQLVEFEGEACLSIFMPTEMAGAEILQNPIRLKNILDDARAKLAAHGMQPAEMAAFLESLENLVPDTIFWQHQSCCFAAFVREGSMQTLRLPIECQETVIVGDHFFVTPLFALQQGRGQFFVLSLDQNQIRLFRASQYSVEEMELENMPLSIEETQDIDGGEHVQWSGAAANRRGKMEASNRGQGGGEGDEKEDILRFFRRVDEGLKAYLREESNPLVIAGVEYLHSIYKEANTYANLIEEGIEGSPKMKDGKELREEAWQIVQPLFDRGKEQDLLVYGNLSATDRTSTNIQEIVPAAYFSRVDTLFIGKGNQVWGRFDESANRVTVHSVKQDGDQDLVNQAAIYTHLRGGKVYLLDAAEVPGGESVAATFRYAESNA